MKQKLTLWALALAVVGATLLPLAFRAQPGTPPPAPPAAAASPAPQHPRIDAAIHHLEEAKRELQAAPEEFHGHRAKAIGHVDQALEECHKALESVR